MLHHLRKGAACALFAAGVASAQGSWAAEALRQPESLRELSAADVAAVCFIQVGAATYLAHDRYEAGDMDRTTFFQTQVVLQYWGERRNQYSQPEERFKRWALDRQKQSDSAGKAEMVYCLEEGFRLTKALPEAERDRLIRAGLRTGKELIRRLEAER